MSVSRFVAPFLNSIKSGIFNPGKYSISQFSSTKINFKDDDSKESSENEEKKPKTEGEQKLIDMLRNRFQTAKEIEVIDISGGCGNMYAIFVESEEFIKVRKVKQHKMVNEVLNKEIKENMHGIRIQTCAPGEPL